MYFQEYISHSGPPGNQHIQALAEYLFDLWKVTALSNDQAYELVTLFKNLPKQLQTKKIDYTLIAKTNEELAGSFGKTKKGFPSTTAVRK